MNESACKIGVALLIGLLASCAGCSAGKEYDAAQKAELRGAAHEAYDNYRRAAKEHPGNGAVADGLKRTGQAAAEFWEAEAIVATDDGRIADAWRMWMRALEIRPDHPTAPRMIRQLEERHPEAIAVAKTDYLQRGPITLAAVRPSGKVAISPPSEAVAVAAKDRAALPGAVAARPLRPDRGATPEAVAAAVRPASPGDSSAADQPSGSSSAIEPTAIAMASSNRDAQRSAPPGSAIGNGSVVDAQPSERKAPAGRATDQGSSVSSPAELGSPATADKPRFPLQEASKPLSGGVPTKSDTEPKPPPRKQNDAEERKIAKSPEVPPPAWKPSEPARRPEPRKSAEARSGSAPPSGASEFASVLLLSKNDRRYPKQADLVDGICVTIRDTDDDLDADLDLHQGKERIKKVRSLPVGRSCVFRGRSGAYYRLTVLDIFHKTRTARIGVKPA